MKLKLQKFLVLFLVCLLFYLIGCNNSFSKWKYYEMDKQHPIYIEAYKNQQGTPFYVEFFGGAQVAFLTKLYKDMSSSMQFQLIQAMVATSYRETKTFHITITTSNNPNFKLDFDGFCLSKVVDGIKFDALLGAFLSDNNIIEINYTIDNENYNYSINNNGFKQIFRKINAVNYNYGYEFTDRSINECIQAYNMFK